MATTYCQEHREGVSATPGPLWAGANWSGPWRPQQGAGGGREPRSRPWRKGGREQPAGELGRSRRGCRGQQARVPRTAGAKKQAMGTQCLMDHPVRLGLEHIRWGWWALKDGAMAPSILCSLTLSPICPCCSYRRSILPSYLTQRAVLLPALTTRVSSWQEFWNCGQSSGNAG